MEIFDNINSLEDLISQFIKKGIKDIFKDKLS